MDDHRAYEEHLLAVERCEKETEANELRAEVAVLKERLSHSLDAARKAHSMVSLFQDDHAKVVRLLRKALAIAGEPL